ncbi:MAG TPA: NYN domain-containing protein [Oscillatoriaceae cyanobacterium]
MSPEARPKKETPPQEGVGPEMLSPERLMNPSYVGGDPTSSDERPKRVIAYIDGFNMYFGLREKKWRKYYWYDPSALVRNLAKPDQQVAVVKFFTSRVVENQAQQKRQSVYLDALRALGCCELIYGQYLSKPQQCSKCGYVGVFFHEKKTDVNIAVEMLADAFEDRYDVAMLISGDSDLASPIERIRRLFPKKRVVVAFPPGRKSEHLAKLAHGSFMIGEGKLGKSLLPAEVKADGITLRSPWH